ncbi:MAG: hypothetical protein JWN34_2647 [Bryobacterales bacterium]|nr:hypothetical protein [Bryobacterales bacterium]
MNEQSQNLMRAITGPVILITVGVLFTIDRFSSFGFAQTWPILLIVIGLLKLLGGRRRREFIEPPPPPGGIRQ